MDVRLLVCEGGALECGGQPLQEHSVRLLSIRSWLWPGRSLGHGYEGCVSLGERQTVPSGRMDGLLRSARSSEMDSCRSVLHFCKTSEKNFLKHERELTGRKSWEVKSSIRRQIFLI